MAEISGYVRGIPTYTELNGSTYGMLCETKEKCVTDDSGVALDYKLEDLQRQIDEAEENHATKASVEDIVNGTTKAGDADKLDGQDSSYFATAKSVTDITDGTVKVGNAEKLDGQDSSHFATAESVANITNGTTKVGNAGKLDGNTADAFAKKTDLANYLQGVVVATDPGVGASTSYANGTLIFVKE